MALFRRKKDPGSTTPTTRDSVDDTLDALYSSEPAGSGSFVPASYEDAESMGMIGDDDLYSGETFSPNDDSDKPVTNKKNLFIIIGAVVAVVGVLGAFALMGGEDSAAPEKEESSTSQEESSHAPAHDGLVVSEKLGETYSGNDNGSPVNGTGAILSFDHAYYTLRDGEKARERFNPTTTRYDAEFIQTEIDKVPQGTSYSLDITPIDIGKKYEVVLHLTLPGTTTPVSWKQDFTTMEKDGTFFVQGFTSSSMGR